MNLSEDLRSIYRDFSVGATFDGRTVFVIKDEPDQNIDPGQRGGPKFTTPAITVRFITADLKTLSPGDRIEIEGTQYKASSVDKIADGLESIARLEKTK